MTNLFIGVDRQRSSALLHMYLLSHQAWSSVALIRMTRHFDSGNINSSFKSSKTRSQSRQHDAEQQWESDRYVVPTVKEKAAMSRISSSLGLSLDNSVRR